MVRLGGAGGSILRWIHIVWAILALTLCVLLTVTGGGHPPPIIFVPLVVVIWAVGHLLLWGIAWLAARGKSRAGERDGETSAWPFGLSIALIGTGTVSALGVFQVVMSLMLERWYPFDVSLWFIALLIALAHLSCFAGILLRRPWSRFVTALLSLGWVLTTGWQTYEQLSLRFSNKTLEATILIGAGILLTWLGFYLLASHRVRKYFQHN